MSVLSGIAVDWLADNLYWTDFSLNQIWMSRADGLFQKVVARNLSGPYNIVVDQTRKCDCLKITLSKSLLLLRVVSLSTNPIVEMTFVTTFFFLIICL